MALIDEVNERANLALKAGDNQVFTACNGLKSVLLLAIKENADVDQLSILRSRIKQQKETIEYVSDPVRLDKEVLELKLLESFLPQQMSDTQLEQIVDEVMGQDSYDVKDMGRLITLVSDKTGEMADRSRIAAVVKKRLSS